MEHDGRPSRGIASMEAFAADRKFARQLPRKQAARISRLPVLDVMAREPIELPDPHDLWVVDHLVEAVPGSSGRTFDRYTFDFEAANAQIERAGGRWRSETNGWVFAEAVDLVDLEAQAGTPAPKEHRGASAGSDDEEDRKSYASSTYSRALSLCA